MVCPLPQVIPMPMPPTIASSNFGGGLPQNSNAPKLDYGNSNFDIRHRFTFTTTYSIPGIKGYAQMLEGWQINSIVSAQTAQTLERSGHQ